jgi:glycosyltransferase involved in cell wall biosynthesis
MPNVILEAMANGLAIAATDVGATNILVNDKTGWLMSSSSINEIKKTIFNIIKSSPGQVEAKKRAALELIREKFVWEKLVRQLIQKLHAMNEN